MKFSIFHQTEPFSCRLKSYLLWMVPVAIVFFSLYPTINTFTAARHDTLALWIPAELGIPLIPAFIWVYFSFYLIILAPVFFLTQSEQKRLAIELMVITVIGALFFLLFPAKLGFVRQIPSAPLYQSLFKHLFMLDQPHNLVPSLHVAWSCTAVLAITRKHVGWIAWGLYSWLILIALSTLFVHQHHLLDVITGGLLSFTTCYLTGIVYEKNTRTAANVG
ncbi:phosphatase PAP2 family protein [Hafnia sp. HMSC23F03]|uniref:phosphatase PAP2 family protein n=1 Tax=Hafnia sp. HMSC23F03 TaxID=1581059 RepID=UPI0008A54E85|nr:phosphatase PAP2 family protein [Hafnia sp. HMSC23F03]OFS10968.1 Ser/Thr and Tyr protein phosphatase [Hafnia sp. HMSC23F03]